MSLSKQTPRETQGASEALKVAIDIGDLQLCMRLVEGETDLTSGFGGCKGCTPLLYSLHKKKHAIAKYLVSQGASTGGSTCKAWSTRGFTAFHYAAAYGSVELFQLLLEKAPSGFYVSHDPIHPIHLAVLNNNAECVKLMLDHASQGMNPSSHQFIQSSNETTDTGKGTPIFNQLGTWQEVLHRMVNLQVRRDVLRWSWAAAPREPFPEVLITAKPLHIAASEGNSHIVSLLMDYGASIEGVDGGYATPLHHAVSNGHTETVKLLLDSGANPNAVNKGLESPCMKAVEYDDLDSIQSLIRGGADIQLRNRHGETAVHLAARYKAKDVFVFLTGKMTRHDFGAEDVFGRSGLYTAMTRASTFPMNFLWNLAPSAGSFESSKDIILDAAVKYRSTDEVKWLLRRIPSNLMPRFINHRALNSGTPLHVAASLDALDLMNLLLDAGAQLELEGSEHGTALMGACATGRLAAVQLLVARGARISYAKDGQVYSALLAAKYHSEVRRWLLVGRFLEGPRLLAYESDL